MGNKRKKKLQTQVGKYLKGPLYFIAFWIMINVITYAIDAVSYTHLSGVNVVKTKYIAYIFCGVCSAIAGMIMLASLGSAEATAGSGYETNAIAAAAIGGTRMEGGKGTALGTFIGALMLAVLKVGMVVINVDSFWQFVVTCFIIIVAPYFEFIQQDVAGFISRHKKAEN